MCPICSIATVLLVASVALVGCGSRDGDQAGPDTGPPASAPVTVAPTTPAPPRPPNTAEAVATATSFMRREVGMAQPLAGPFRWTGARTGQVDIRARLVFTPTGTGAAWSARVVAEDRTAADGLRLAWNPEGGVLGRLTVEALGPGGTARREIGSVHRE
jgi:hypothetical protein